MSHIAWPYLWPWIWSLSRFSLDCWEFVSELCWTTKMNKANSWKPSETIARHDVIQQGLSWKKDLLCKIETSFKFLGTYYLTLTGEQHCTLYRYIFDNKSLYLHCKLMFSNRLVLHDLAVVFSLFSLRETPTKPEPVRGFGGIIWRKKTRWLNTFVHLVKARGKD